MPVRLTVVGESCPVCGSEAERGQDTRDVVNIRCPRCGPFTISGTALAMLTSRLENNERSRARASHAIRSTTSDEHWLEIDSTSVDKLVGERLPPIERQIDNFLKWMSYKLDDDQMGTIQLPDDVGHLAGVVGAVDRDSVGALISAMQKGELIELPANNRVRLTMAAWNRLDKLAERASKNDATAWIINGAGSQAELAFPLPEILKAHCPNCNAHRKAEVMTRYIEAQEDNVIFVTVDDYRILKCRGCDAV